MPIYEYECGACGAVHDVLHKLSDSPPRKCPSCGRLKLRRLISAPKFRLKGEGWYETDFKTGDKRNLADGGDKESAKTDDKSKSSDKADKKAAGDKPSKTDGASAGKKKKAGKAA
ncbi:MAG: zinc ribbon domain-containing protein [Pseudomonadota bacterium]